METSPRPAGTNADPEDGNEKDPPGAPLQVVVVDDSAVVRTILTRALESDPGIVVAEAAQNGAQAVRRVPRLKPDVVVLDIDMPVMDGLEALPHLIRDVPGLPVIVASTMTTRNADITIRALAAGAADYITKPGNSSEFASADDFRIELIRKVRALGETRRRRLDQPAPPPRCSPAAAQVSPAPAIAPDQIRDLPVVGRRRGLARPPKAIVIASSTGGPQALFTLLAGLPQSFGLPVLIAQHMPPAFTEMLAAQIARVSGRPCTQARDGEAVRQGHIYVAPGDHHMTVAAGADDVIRLRLDQGPKENYCRPSADPLLRSAVETYDSRLLAVVLTGMGSDGLAGCRLVASTGGGVIAQDEASSVVWGMPGSVVRKGLANAVLPIGGIAEVIGALADGKDAFGSGAACQDGAS